MCSFEGMITIFSGIAIYYMLLVLKIIEEAGREIFKIEPIITVTYAAIILAALSFIVTFIKAYVDLPCAVLMIAGMVFMIIIFIWIGTIDLLKITLGDIIMTIAAALLAIGLKAYLTGQEASYY